MTLSDLNGLPATWAIAELSEIVHPDRPRHLPSAFPDLPFVGMEHVEAHSMQLLGTVPARTMKSSAVHFWPGDVLYGRLRPYLNKVVQPDFEGLCSAEFIVFPPSTVLDSRYLKYLLNSADFVSFASHLNEGDRPRVDFQQIGTYKVPLPPLAEQRRIVAEIETQFTRLDAAVAALKRARMNLDRYKAGLTGAACSGSLTQEDLPCSAPPVCADELLRRILSLRASTVKGRYPTPMKANWTTGDVPQGWALASIDQLCERITSGSRDWSKFYDRGTGTFLMAQNIRPMKWSEPQIANQLQSQLL